MEKRSNNKPFGRQFSGNRFGGAKRNGFERSRFGVPAVSGRSKNFGRNRGGRGGKRFGEESINHAKFIQKAVITERMEVFKPEHLFSDFNIDARLKAVIASRKYESPTPIQDKIIPHILNVQDVVGIANTGTGKTAAFLIPLIDKVLKNNRENILIIAPTRELAIQIQTELKSFTSGMNIFSVCAVGGAPIGRQISELKYQNNFIIGTPGRIKDLVEQGKIKLATFNTIVLDEADRMLDMGFVNDMKFLMAKMPENRHTLFFSATLSPEIERLISSFLKNEVRISVKVQDSSKNVDQDIVRVGTKPKIDVLHDLLIQEGFKKVIIFGKTKHGVERLSLELEKRGFRSVSIHGNKNHSNRQRSLKMFKDNNTQVLVATDVAARGLDINDVTHVINYDLPATYDDYVHRIGRTGRAGKLGKALTFVN